MVSLITDYTLPQRQDRARKRNARVRATRLVSERHPARPDNGDAVIKLYLREIGRVQPLTPQEEMELVARIKQGDRKARERLIKGSLQLVAEISRQDQNIGLPLLDLISEGNLGLLKAVERFDPAKGGSFSACRYLVDQAIHQARSGPPVQGQPVTELTTAGESPPLPMQNARRRGAVCAKRMGRLVVERRQEAGWSYRMQKPASRRISFTFGGVRANSRVK